MVSKIFSQFLLILAARIPSSPYRNLGRWPFLMLISEHLPNLPNLPLFVCWSKCWSNPRVGQCSEWHRWRLCRFSSASARSCSTRASFLSNILSWPQFAGREDVVFCDLLSKKTYDNHLIANVQNIFYNNTHRQTTKKPGTVWSHLSSLHRPKNRVLIFLRGDDSEGTITATNIPKSCHLDGGWAHPWTKRQKSVGIGISAENSYRYKNKVLNSVLIS